jgi:hypothetical protein
MTTYVVHRCELCTRPTKGPTRTGLCRKCCETKPRTDAGWEKARRERPAKYAAELGRLAAEPIPTVNELLAAHKAKVDARYVAYTPRTDAQPETDYVDHVDFDPPKPLRNFIQVDGWANQKPGDYMMVPDADGDVLMMGDVREPQASGTTVRIHIAADAERSDVLRIIRKQLAWLEDGSDV